MAVAGFRLGLLLVDATLFSLMEKVGPKNQLIQRNTLSLLVMSNNNNYPLTRHIFMRSIKIIFLLLLHGHTPNAFCDQSVPRYDFSLLRHTYGHILSPDGSSLAYYQNHNNSTRLLVTDLESGKNYGILSAQNEKIRIGEIFWANNDTLLYKAYLRKDVDGSKGDKEEWVSLLFSTPKDGKGTHKRVFNASTIEMEASVSVHNS